MNNNTIPPIDDDEIEKWLTILNGSQEAETNNEQQQKTKRIRMLALQQLEQEHEQQYAAERQRLQQVLQQQGLLEPAKPVVSSMKCFFDKLNQFISSHKRPVAFAMMGTLAAILVIPRMITLVESPAPLAKDLVIIADNDGMRVKGITSFPPTKKRVVSAHQQALAVQQQFISAGLQVTLEKTAEGWLLQTVLPVPLAQHQAVLAVIDKYALELPMGESPLRVLFIEK